MELGRVHLNLKTVLLTMMMFKWGIFCSASSDTCLSAPCQNGATCIDNQDDYVCICPRDGLRYMGKDCHQLYNACSFAPCEECTSVPGTLEYHCVCPDGLSGDNCTEDVDECESGPCSEPRSSCIDRLNGYFCRCPAGHGGDHCRTRVTDCIDEPCQNNGTCVLLAEGFSCRCADGFEGLYCEEDVNECSSQPCQNGAICMDGVAEFHCFCVPGFQGFNCEIDINECASRPCENNATCINEKDRYECECLHGFSGVNCETEIDECESNPCQNKATCYDLIGTYSCECMPGFNGTDCEVDVDECASEPCQNGAACHDLVNSYACDCTETGFMGDHCEEDILECSSGPCQHGATCLEGVKEYNCLCWPGYDGQHCEVDVDECATQPCQNAGDCFERSDPSHWELDWELDYADAAGYICQCQTGFTGENCSVNIDECESDPCQNGGICEDQINGYTCTCAAGFTGDICEINIDECESQPCHNGGWCDDSVASYICHCPDAEPGKLPWGGDRCHVKLYGCVENECQNGATCHPWLKDEVHGHTCLCPHGFYDEHCSTQTTFSFSALGFVHIEVVQEDRRRRGAEQREHLVQGVQGVQLRFRTTLTNMLLFYRGDGTNFLLLEIVSSGLHAKAVVEESVLDVTFPGLVSDGDWWDANAFVTKDSLVLIIKGPGCEPQGCKIVDGDHNGLQLNPLEAFTHVYVGGAPDGLLEQTVSGAGFLGCMEDLKIDSKPILPQDLPEDQSHELGCSKTDWCESEPCSGHGHCIDLWINYQCDCHRPFRSESCSEESQSWTYSHEDTVSYSKYRVGSSHKGNFSVSFFMRSVKPEGLLFQLRRRAEEEGDEGEVYFSVYLGMGRMFVSSRPHSTPLTAPIYVTTGDRQLLHVEVQHRQVIFEHAGLRYGIGEIPEVEVNSGDWAYVGGLPRGWDSDTWGGHFKGCLQDLRLDTVPLVLEALKSSEEESSYLASYAENIQIGCVSDDTCQVEPCENEGSCSVTFNDFTCSCPERYTGKSCETRVWCATDPCVNGGRCVDLKDGYECVYNATFENNPVRYSAGGTLFEPVTAIYIELRTRSENAVLLRANHGSDLLLVGLLDSSLHVKIHAGNNVETLAFTGIRRLADGQWHRVTIAMAEQEKETSHWVITVDGITDASSMPELAGSIQFLNDEKAVLSIAESFTGCLGAVRLGGVYLPYVDHHGAPQSSQFHLVGTTKVDVGCKSAPVCDSDPCQNGARCEDLFNKYGCVCGAGWTGERCQIDLDDCVSGPCAHGSCKDYLSGFECECQPGYAGTLCDEDLNECEHHACEHGGTCKDGPNTYTCICPKEFTGPLCQWEYPPAECGKDVQCLNEGFCNDGPWGANCTCMPGYTGVRCEMDVDECASNPCRNGGSCLDRFNRFLCVCPPGHSGPVCDTNKQAQKDRVPWLVVAIPLVCIGVLIFVISLTIMVLTARKKRQSEGAYSPSSQELAGARLEMDSMFKVPPEERLI